MLTSNQILSLKKTNRRSINEMIIEKEDDIKRLLDIIFTDVHAANQCGIYLQELSALKNAKVTMMNNVYAAYEESGKEVDFDTFRSQIDFG